MPRAYYNEHDPYAAQWLRNLISANLIAQGDVDERSILDVSPDDLSQYTQCHFFAGIAGWSHALRLAGIPDDYPVWTGSPPCQPFSSAGKQRGKEDERHLWPVFFDLIRQCRPAVIFGEQVESAIAHGWLDDLQDDLEGEGYACGAVIAPACSVGAPHIRQRLLWSGVRVADTCSHGCNQGRERIPSSRGNGTERDSLTAASPESGWMADSAGIRRDEWRGTEGAAVQGECAERSWEHPQPTQSGELQGRPEGLGRFGGYDDNRPQPTSGRRMGANTPDNFWRDSDWLFCQDGKWRPVEPGTFPLAHGVSAGVGQLRAYGNAIVPQVAAEFIQAVMKGVK